MPGAADTFILAATEQHRRRAELLLAADPAIERDAWARLVLGRGWDGDPVAPGGPRGWAPLLYVCHSAFASADLARELLARGADPDVTFRNEYGEMSALYGAAGVVHDPELTRVLLEAGANPDDGESLYHATEAREPECLRLLLEHGARTSGTNALAHALDYDRVEPVRLLLEAGFPVAEGAHVAHAVRRGRGPEVVRLLAAHGADLDEPGGETWRGDVPLRSPYRQAVLRGADDVAETLAELGADTTTEPDDHRLRAIARGERPDALPHQPLDPDAQKVVIMAGLRGHAALVTELFGTGFEGVVGGSPSGTLLHHAAWVADAGVVRQQLAAGADPDAPSGAAFSTPLAWAFLASNRRPDYVEVAELLVAAGAELEPRFAAVADGPLADWLAARSS